MKEKVVIRPTEPSNKNSKKNKLSRENTNESFPKAAYIPPTRMVIYNYADDEGQNKR